MQHVIPIKFSNMKKGQKIIRYFIIWWWWGGGLLLKLFQWTTLGIYLLVKRESWNDSFFPLLAVSYRCWSKCEWREQNSSAVWSPHSTLKGTGVRDDPYIQTYQRKSLDETCKELCDWVSNVPKLKRTIQLMFQHWSVLEKRGKALCENHRIYLFVSSKNQLKPDVCVLLCVLCGSLQCNLARSQVYLTSSCVQKVISSALAQ